MADITNPEVVQYAEDQRSRAELLTVLKGTLESAISRYSQRIGPLLAGASPDDVIDSGRDGVQNLTVYQLGAIKSAYDAVLAALTAAGVQDNMEAASVRKYEVRTFGGFTA